MWGSLKSQMHANKLHISAALKAITTQGIYKIRPDLYARVMKDLTFRMRSTQKLYLIY